jgi:hydrogenase maturation protein HypF
VQGVGFRPAVYTIARRLGLTGFVFNDTKGVTIELQGQQEGIGGFLERLQGEDKPAMAQIKSVEAAEIEPVEGEEKFVIKESESLGAALSQVTPDMAICCDCLSEMRDEKDFRYRYPFINCTNCGPRYSIVKTIPYDRPNTTMSVFAMCEKCSGQYRDVSDRRFHAQPVACGACGPKVWLTDSNGKAIETQTEKVIAETARLLRAGKIAAIKGVGGFHLAVDALNEEAVERLRQRKKREYKPFAMMTDSVEKIRRHAEVSASAEKLLRSPESPIVLLPKKASSEIATSVAEGVNTFGFMLCYAPLHYLLFAEGLDVLVMTSGNITDEPLICKNEKAMEKLGDIADVFLMHDREIYRQVDDSIVHFVDEAPTPLRRARGYVPTPILMEEVWHGHPGRARTGWKPVPPDIFAAGADMKNTFCFVKGNQLICSEHIGELEDAEVYHHYIRSVEHFKGLFEVEPKVAVCDLHPGYLSTQYAHKLASAKRSEDGMAGVKVISVQHHWAHIASVLAENDLNGPVIGIAADGTGYGTDGAIWGCECLIASLESFERFGHLAYYDLAGADKASKESLRPLLGLLKKAYGDNFQLEKFKWLLERVEDDASKQQLILEQIEKRVNCVKTSSLGRVFDAAAAMVGLGNYNHFEAQLPMALEAIAAEGCEENYNFELNEQMLIDLGPMIKEIVSDMRENKDRSIISAKFHNTLGVALLATAKQAREKTKLNTVAISGGVFCNRYLSNRLIRSLKEDGFEVLFHREVPANDGGISLGQAAIAAKIASRKS